MVHNYRPLNDSTIKTGYPIKRLDEAIQAVGQRKYKVFFKTDATNGKGQLCYLRIGQGLSGSPRTYYRLKEIVTGDIPEPHPEPHLGAVHDDCGFSYDEQAAMDRVKRAIINNVRSGGDPNVQYHLATDALATGGGVVLFQITEYPPGTDATLIPIQVRGIDEFGKYDRSILRRIKREAAKYTLVDTGTKRYLAYKERNGTLSRCITED
ncbi:hypothetical protein AC579_5310 [Pseudocercospora musae]|uniref:Uncharacterized protein n=1 Tax=Pseudocercospora musae TaxID=113226 RepID=A0A139HZS0_9PEZI|nr:hypothetical protein AC579_5310 [Pseudocercospora musae]